MKTNKIIKRLFMELENSGSNGIIGPGYDYWEIWRISWGKIAVLLILIFSILYLLK